jgi:integrase
MQHLDREQARDYLGACCDDYRPLAELLIATGLRIGEAVALEWADVDLDALTLRVSRSWKLGGTVGTPKTDRVRVVHIDPDTAAMIERHRRSRDRLSHLVFSTASGGILGPSNVRNRWHRKALAAAGLNPQLRLHDLCHTAATIAVAAGESVLFVQAQFGHADVRTTQRYAHADHQAHRAAAARVAAFRNQAGSAGKLAAAIGSHSIALLGGTSLRAGFAFARDPRPWIRQPLEAPPTTSDLSWLAPPRSTLRDKSVTTGRYQ